MQQFLLVDGSYYLFYRYFAMVQWYKHSHPGEVLVDPAENKDFMERFRAVFVKKFHEIVKKLKLENPIIIVALDCFRKDIWRRTLFKTYKDNRVGHIPLSSVFHLLNFEKLFKEARVNMVMRHPRLEADDCIALSIRNIRKICPSSKVYIIASDMDYLQLADENTIPIDLRFRRLTSSKTSFGDAKKDLFCKIVMGDKSDNIPSVFKKCGIKTAEKCYENPDLFKQKLEKECAYAKYELNRKLIDFNGIPQVYVDEFNSGEYTVEASEMRNKLKLIIKDSK